MQSTLLTLTTAAASLGFLHTVLGPDHYLPFIAMSRARNWSPARAAVVTALCGIGHVGSSVLLGSIGIALGLAVAGLEAFESLRGDLAAWALIAFGLVYMVWGLRRASRGGELTSMCSGTPMQSATFTSTTTAGSTPTCTTARAPRA